MDPVTGAVIIAGLKYGGEPAAKVVTEFLGKVLAPTGTAIGEIIAHPIVEWQKKRVAKGNELIQKAALAIQQAGQEPNPVPPRLLIPLLEKGSLEDNAELHEKWVNLLASAATDSLNEILTAYVSILSELTPAEVAVLDDIYEEMEDEDRYISDEIDITDYAFEIKIPEERMELYAGNFSRLGIWQHGTASVDTQDVISVVKASQPVNSQRKVPPPFISDKLKVSRRHGTYEFTTLGLKADGSPLAHQSPSISSRSPSFSPTCGPRSARADRRRHRCGCR